MDAVLIQPPNAGLSLNKNAIGTRDDRYLSPCWDLLCLRSHILKHTRYRVRLIDTRFFRDLDSELSTVLNQQPAARFAIVYTTTHNLGPAAAILDIIKVKFPGLKTVICGPFPSAFPEQAAAMPRVDFMVSGDPEPCIESLLRHIDMPKRLERIEGLATGGAGNPPRPHWLNSLDTLRPDHFQDVFWQAYRNPHGGIEACMRCSRGHTKKDADRAEGMQHEPLRVFSMERMATTIESCRGLGITEIVLQDPPGFWSSRRLESWCHALIAHENQQPWRIQLLPMDFTQRQVEDLEQAGCSGIDIVLPSCRPELLEKYKCCTDFKLLRQSIKKAEDRGVLCRLIFWLGGVEEKPPEHERILRTLKLLRYPSYRLEIFPCLPDCTLYNEVTDRQALPHIEDWLKWSGNPWMSEAPVYLWRGRDSLNHLQPEAEKINRGYQRSVKRMIRDSFLTLTSRNWIREIEDRMITAAAPGPPPGP